MNGMTQTIMKQVLLLRKWLDISSCPIDLYTLREDHSDTKIIDIAIFDGKSPERSSKFYEFKNDKSQSVEKVSQDVLKLIEDQNLSETEKGEVLKVLRKIMKFSNSKDEKISMKKIKHILGLSGGKDSAALAVHMNQKHPEIDIEILFYRYRL